MTASTMRFVTQIAALVALVATAVLGVAHAAPSGPRAAEQAAARLDFSEASRLDESQRAPEALGLGPIP